MMAVTTHRSGTCLIDHLTLLKVQQANTLQCGLKKLTRLHEPTLTVSVWIVAVTETNKEEYIKAAVCADVLVVLVNTLTCSHYEGH